MSEVTKLSGLANQEKSITKAVKVNDIFGGGAYKDIMNNATKITTSAIGVGTLGNQSLNHSNRVVFVSSQFSLYLKFTHYLYIFLGCFFCVIPA